MEADFVVSWKFGREIRVYFSSKSRDFRAISENLDIWGVKNGVYLVSYSKLHRQVERATVRFSFSFVSIILDNFSLIDLAVTEIGVGVSVS